MSLFQLNGDQTRPLEVQVEINGRPLVMELDTGAAVSLVPDSVFKDLCPGKHFQESTHLRTYSGERLPVLGQLQVEVRCGDQQARLPLRVVQGQGLDLFGRDWLCHLRLDWNCIHQVQSGAQPQLSQLLEKH